MVPVRNSFRVSPEHSPGEIARRCGLRIAYISAPRGNPFAVASRACLETRDRGTTRGTRGSRVSIVSLEGQILDLVAAHDEREMAKLLLDERARVEEARSILLEALPALAIHARAGSEEAFIRACAFIGSNPENWTQDPGVLASRRAGGPPGVSALAPEGGSPAPDTGLARRAGELEARTEAGHLETQLLAPPEKAICTRHHPSVRLCR